MVIPVPTQAYIDSLIASMRAQGLYHEGLCQLLCATIDQFCARQPQPQGAGRHKTYSDATILKLDLLMHLTGKHGETEILREVKRHYAQYFDALPAQPRLWHRVRQALPLLEQFRCELRTRLGVTPDNLRILDSLPIPVATLASRQGRGNGFDLAEWGYCASKKLHYLGFKLGVVITAQGIPDNYDLFSARPHDVHLVQDLLGDARDLVALGDKGFISDPKHQQLLETQNVLLITYRRRNQKKQNTPLEEWTLDTFRRLIETVFSQLDGHMHLEHTGAKTDNGLSKRIIGILTAYTCGIYLNTLLGREPLAIKELFA
jgi:Transposase DDE domain